MRKDVLILLIVLLVASLAAASESQLTIYNDNFSLIRSKLTLNLKSGLQDYLYEDIPNTIDPKSVILSSKNNALQIFSQNYEFDLANADQIMQKYIGEKIIIQTEKDYTLKGILQFSQASTLGILEEGTDKLILINRSTIRNITLAELPDNFYLRPTLRWRLQAPAKGKYQADVSYLCNGLSWDVDYNCVWNPDNNSLLLNAWVTIKNYTGKSFNDVKLKLIAGDVNRVNDYLFRGGRNQEVAYSIDGMSAKKSPEFNEKAFHDFHLYTLDQSVSIANKQIKQIQLFPSKKVTAKQNYAYRTFATKIESQIIFMNDEKSGLNIPIPAGRIKIYQKDQSDKSLEFIGEDKVNHTATDEQIVVTTGNAFDLIGKTVVLDTKKIDHSTYQKKLKVTISNRSKEAKEINITHYLSGEWEVYENNFKYKKVDAHQIKITKEIAAGGKAEIVWTERIKN